MTALSVLFDQMGAYLPSREQIRIENIEDGFSNDVKKLHWANAPRAVLRVPMLDVSAFMIDRTTELRVLEAASESGISPSIIWSDDSGTVLSEYLNVPTLNWDVSHNRINVERIGRQFSNVHQLNVEAPTRNIYEIIEHYIQCIESGDSALCFKEELVYLLDCFNSLKKVDYQARAAVLCHNDLNPKNVLLNEQEIWFIDWEYTALGDPLFDLAVVSRSHNLSPELQRVLVESYNTELDVSETLAVIHDYGFAYALREMAWLLLKHVLATDDIQSLDYYHEFKESKSLNPFI